MQKRWAKGCRSRSGAPHAQPVGPRSGRAERPIYQSISPSTCSRSTFRPFPRITDHPRHCGKLEVTKWLRSWSSRRGALISCREAPISRSASGLSLHRPETAINGRNWFGIAYAKRRSYEVDTFMLFPSRRVDIIAQGARKSHQSAMLKFTTSGWSYSPCTSSR